MTKTKGLLFTAGLILAIAFTFSCSSDDDSGGRGGYLPCSEAVPLFGAINTAENACSLSCPDEDDRCIFACMEKDENVKKICGGNSYKKCKDHYNTCSSGGDGGGSSSSDGGGGGSVVYGDPVTYGSETYKTVVIGTQTWMAKNLNYAGNYNSGKCYNNLETNCGTYGRLYTWSEAKNVCPDGWHLPNDAEWSTLVNFVGGENAGRKLMAKSGWSSDGTDEYGFSALPGGDGYSDGSFSVIGLFGYWWTVTEDGANNAYMRSIDDGHKDAYVGRSSQRKSRMYSVRCVKD